MANLQTKVPCLPPSAVVPRSSRFNLSVNSEWSLTSASDKRMGEINTNVLYFGLVARESFARRS